MPAADPWGIIGWGIIWTVATLAAAVLLARVAVLAATRPGVVLAIVAGAAFPLFLQWACPWFVAHPVWSLLIAVLLCTPLAPALLGVGRQRGRA